jgi:hypothetical protein
MTKCGERSNPGRLGQLSNSRYLSGLGLLRSAQFGLKNGVIHCFIVVLKLKNLCELCAFLVPSVVKKILTTENTESFHREAQS